MSNLILPNILKFLLLLLLADTVVPVQLSLLSNCSNFRWANNYVNNYIWSIVGEWRVVDCTVNNNDQVDATLWFNQNKKIEIVGRVKVISRNKFNITNLQLSDMGKYYCEACGKMKTHLRMNVKRGTPFAKPEISKPPTSSRSMIKYGSTVTLECSLKGSYNDYEMLWFKVQSNGKYLEQKSTSRSTWSSDYNNRVQREVLRISNFIEENEEYFCQVRRYGVKYIRKTDHVKLRLETLAMPVISNFPRNGKLIEKEEETRDVNYCVLGTPSPDVAWYKAVDGKRELITKCSGTTNTCLPINNKDIEVKLHSFVIKNASYVRHHNVTYICRAENVKGQDEKNFTVFVETKPRLVALKSEIQIYKKNLDLHCVLSKNANPENISYSWAYCDKDVNNVTSCQSTDDWKPVQSRQNNTIKILPHQAGGIRLYRCTADNRFKKDQLIWTIVRPIGQTIPKGICDNIAVVAKLESEKEEKSGNSSMEPIVVWQGIVAFLAILLLVTLFLTFRRRNPPKQEYNTCVVPVLKEKIGDSV